MEARQEKLLSIVLVDQDKFVLDGAAILAAASRLAPQAGAGAFLETASADGGSSLIITLGGATFVALRVDRSVPGDEVAVAAERAYWWPTAQHEVARHRGHIIVAPLRVPESGGTLDVLGSARLLTALTAAVCEAVPGCMAALWAASQVLQPAGTLSGFATES